MYFRYHRLDGACIDLVFGALSQIFLFYFVAMFIRVGKVDSELTD